MATLPSAPAGARNVLLIVWDTVRAAIEPARLRPPDVAQPRAAGRPGRAVRPGVCDRPVDPAISRSLFTGRWPHELTADWLSPLDETHTTLAEYLGGHGYDTAGFVANLDYTAARRAWPGLCAFRGLPDRARRSLYPLYRAGQQARLLTPASVINRLVKKYFGDAYDVIPRSKEHAKNAATINRSFLDWLSWQRGRGRPFFAS